MALLNEAFLEHLTVAFTHTYTHTSMRNSTPVRNYFRKTWKDLEKGCSGFSGK